MLGKNLVVQITDAFVFSQQKCSYFTKGRSFCALSLRKNTRVRFKSDRQNISMTGDVICLTPPDTDYLRTSYTDEDIIVIHFKVLNADITEFVNFEYTELGELESCFEKILHCWQEKREGYYLEAQSGLYELLWKLERQAQNSPKYGKDYADRAIELIEAGFQNSDFTIGTLSTTLNICSSQLRKRFKERTGISPRDYLLNERIKYAKVLIKTGYFTRNEICERCGFSDAGYFGTAFKRVVGESISSYRKRC